MKKELKGFIIGVILTLSISVLADNWQTISVQPNLINVIVNGEKLNVDNFLYNGTTYLPIRAVSEALGHNVDYDGETNTAYIGSERAGDKVSVLVALPKWETEGELYLDEKNEKYYFYGSYYRRKLLEKTVIEYDATTNNMILTTDYTKTDTFVETLKENIPHIIIDSVVLLSEEYFNNEILPLDEALR